MGAYTGDAVRARLQALNESDLNADGATINPTRPAGADPGPQTVDVVYLDEIPADLLEAIDLPATVIKVRGDTTLDLAVEDRFTIGSTRFVVIQPKRPDDGKQYKQFVIAHSIPS